MEENNDFMKTILQALPEDAKKNFDNMQMDLIEKSPTMVFSYDITSEEPFSNPNTLAMLYIMSSSEILNKFVSYNKSTVKNPSTDIIYIDSRHLMEMSYFVFGGICLLCFALELKESETDDAVKKSILKFFTDCNGFSFCKDYYFAVNNLLSLSDYDCNLTSHTLDYQYTYAELKRRFSEIMEALPFIPYGIIDNYAKEAIVYFENKISNDKLSNLSEICKDILSSLKGDDNNVEPK